MPEGHTIHRQAIVQSKVLVGRVVAVSSPQGRFEGAEAVSGRRVLAVEAWGKHLVYVFDGSEPRRVHVHLGLFGKFRRRRAPVPAPSPTCRMRLDVGTSAIDLVGPTACALVSKKALALLLARLGPDPLRADADKAVVLSRLAKTRASIGAALLDQKVLAGVGNVYRAEALFACAIHPETPARDLSSEQVSRLWDTIVRMLERGVKDGRIVTAPSPPDLPPGRRVPRALALMVYARRECRTCGGEVKRWPLRQRTIYACETCQPRERTVTAASSTPRPRPSAGQ